MISTFSRKGRMKTSPGPRIFAWESISLELEGNGSRGQSDSVQGGAEDHSSLVLLASLQGEEEREGGGEDDQEEGAGMEETCDEPACPGPGGPLNNK